MTDSPAAILGRLGGLATARKRTPEERSEHARAMVKARWAKATPAERKELGKRLAEARKLKGTT